MTKLADLKKAVTELSEAEQNKFRRWYAKFDAEVFDQKIERDAKAGKLDKLAEKALAEHRAGRTREL